MRLWSKAASTIVLASLLFASMPVEANPLVPYCPTSASAFLSATADTSDPELCLELTGRVFPEAMAHADYLSETGPNGFTGGSTGFATDYVSYFEFQAGLDYLATQHPDYIEVHQVATSAGNDNFLGGPSNLPIYMLEISNMNSPIPREEKLNLLFMLSIHGNEKGGREGGFRVLEDLLRNVGFATETVQNGAGMPQALSKPTGGNVETYLDYLDFMSVFLLFPNSDGWACDEIEYGAGGNPLGGGGGCPGLFTRGNGNGVDLNRQLPTIGWHNPNRNVMGEPESGGVGTEFPGYGNWMVEQDLTWNYAVDIHGMLNHKNFGAIMLPAGSFSPQEMHRSLSLAETLKERWNADPHFSEWRTLFQGAEAAWDAAGPAAQTAYMTAHGPLCGVVDEAPDPVECPLPGSALADNPAHEASSSQFAEYYTVIDAIGYTDSGFSGDFFAQTTGLNAPGYDIELAYNHITCSAQYECGVMFNDYHVHMVRHIVKSFMDAAALDVRISYESAGMKTAYVPSQYVATNLDDESPTAGGWADQNPGDDAWAYSLDQPFEARPAKYWEDIQPFLCENCGTDQALPGVLEARNAAELSAAELAKFDTLIIAGSAINQFVSGNAGENSVADGQPDAARIQAITEWVEAGGRLILTDSALKFLDLANITTDAVERTTGYMGGIRFDLSHPFLEKVRGGVKQTYEPTPLGYGTSRAAPNWFVDAAKFSSIEGASVAGLECSGPQLSENCNDRGVALGYVDVGAGRISFIGALLPDPTEEFYHPYGLDDYATTFSGNQIMRNMLGWDEVFASPPITIGDDGKIVQSENEPQPVGRTTRELEGSEGSKGTPALGLAPLALLLGAFALRRRR